MATLKAPFNFVPLYQKAFYPDWADKISQDIPFKDGISGSIHLRITAESPIFIRDGHTQKDQENKTEAYASFCKTRDGQYFIPGTSLKGCIRSVLEILSFGKMTDKTRYQDSSFYIRDLSGGEDGGYYRKKIKPQSVHCGWMRFYDNRYELQDCGIPFRISEEDIDTALGLQGQDLKNFVMTCEFKNDSDKTAQRKYEFVKGKELHGKFIQTKEDYDRQMVKCNPNGEISGTIVLTGQPNQRKMKVDKWEGKYYEFVFRDAENDEWKEIPTDVMDSFLTIHANSVDYKDFRKSQLNKGTSIPVFFRLKDNSDEIECIGLTYMFKYPANNKISDGIPEELQLADPDLSECMFGYTGDEKSLRGRIQFGNAFAVKGTANEEKDTEYGLSSPHPSYYPLYLGHGKTWNSDSVQIAGYKRYPIRNKIESNSGTDKMASICRPLCKGSRFEGDIRYFNLKPAELGALLAAITFDCHEDCYHNLGSGKPLGYGKVKIECSLNGDDAKSKRGYYIDEFKKSLKEAGFDYNNYPEINELFKMAQGIPIGRDDEFTYMKMSTDRKSNEFIQGKDAYSRGEQLGLFSEIIERNVPKAKYQGNATKPKKEGNATKPQKDTKDLVEQRKQKLAEAVNEMNAKLQAGKFKECGELFKEYEIQGNMYHNPDYDEIGKRLKEHHEQVEQLISEIKRLIDEGNAKGAISLYESNPHGINENESSELSAWVKLARVRANEQSTEEISLPEQLEKRNLTNQDKFMVNKLNFCCTKIDQYIKKHTLGESDLAGIENTIRRLAKDKDRNEAKKEWPKFDGTLWKKIRGYLGEDRAKVLFDDLSK